MSYRAVCVSFGGDLKRARRLIGVGIGLLGAVFVARALIRNWDEVTSAVRGADPLFLLGALLVGLVSMTSIGIVWRRCLAILGANLAVLSALRNYFVGQLGKYLPGGIWPVVGRAEMARRDGVGATEAYGSTVLSMSLTYIAAALVATSAWLLGAGTDNGLSWWPVVGAVILGVVALHPLVAERALTVVRRLSRRELNISVPRWGTSVILLISHIPAWLGISTATWLVANTLDTVAPDLRNLMYATSLSWLIGFVAIGVPGGIGVREAVFLATVDLSSLGVAAAVAVVARVVFLLVDLTGAGLSTLVAGLRRSPETAADSALAED